MKHFLLTELSLHGPSKSYDSSLNFGSSLFFHSGFIQSDPRIVVSFEG